MSLRFVHLATLMILATAPAMAQASDSFAASGMVETIDAASITVMDGPRRTVETFKLAPDVLILQNKSATLFDIQPDDFVASATVAGIDGKLHATELRIFPPALRGTGEGQRPMNDARNQTMTNATVTGTAMVNGSNSIRVKFEGGESELMLDPGVPVTRIDTAERRLVKPGAIVSLRGTRDTNGIIVNRITLQ